MTLKQPILPFVAAMLLLAVSGRVQAQSPPAPAIIVEASYPGASAQVVADTVAAPIEQQVNGVEGLRTMVSRCTSDGNYALTVTFAIGTDVNIAQVLVQNRVALALPILPAQVQASGVTVKKKLPGVLLIVNLFSPDNRYDTIYLSNYAAINIQDELARLAGVGAVLPIGARDYSMRIWLDPDKLAARKLTVEDVLEALNQQNLQISARKAGQPPKGKGPATPIDVQTRGRLTEPGEFGAIILKTDAAGRLTRLRDVGRVELGADTRPAYANLNGKAGVVLAVYPTWKAKPPLVSAAVRAEVAKLQKRTPEGVRLDVAFDFTPNLEHPDRPATPEYLLLDPTLPADTSDEKTQKLLERCVTLLRSVSGVQDVLALSDNPFDFVRSRPCILIRLVPSGKRPSNREQMMQILRTRLEKDLPQVSPRLRDVSALGRFPHGGYPIDVVVYGLEADRVRELAEKLALRLRASKKVTDVAVNPETARRPGINIIINGEECARMGISIMDASRVLTLSFGAEVGRFQRFGRTWQVIVQVADKPDKWAESLKQLKIRNSQGKMVPLSRLATVRAIQAPMVVERLGTDPMEQITANPAPGVTLAEIHTLCETLAGDVRRELALPAEYRLTWLRELPEAR